MYDIYSPSADNRLRYHLGRSGSPMLHIFGLNPSTATQEKSDTTVAKVEEVARRHGYFGFVMLNLYPVRATDYNGLPDTPEPEAVESNLAAIAEILRGAQSPAIWAAWGQPILARSYFASSAKLIEARLRRLAPNWLHFGSLTAGGHPRHPSRLSYAWSFAPFNMQAYSAELHS